MSKWSAKEVQGNFNPFRLTLARKRRGFTMSALSKEAGVPSRSISELEKGKLSSLERYLDLLMEALSFPEEFFFAEDNVSFIPEDSVCFRSLARMTNLDRDVAISKGHIAILLNTWIEEHFNLPETQLPIYQNVFPSVAAKALRTEWKLAELPIPNLVHLLESKGVRIFSLNIESRFVDAFSFWMNDTPFIFLNTNKPAERTRFNLAHELGHLVLHGSEILLSKGESKEIEREANAFASCFLLPEKTLKSLSYSGMCVNDLIRFKKKWKVSVWALAYRLRELNLIPEWHYTSLCIEMSQRGYKKNEPEPTNHESSELLRKVFSILRKEGTTKAQIASELHLPVREINELLIGLTLSFITGTAKTSNKFEKKPLTLVS